MLERLNAVNVRHCDQFVIYGRDLHCAVHCMSASAASSWLSVGYANCLEVQLRGALRPHSMSVYWSQTDALKDAICTPENRLERLRDVLDRYVLCLYTALAVALCTIHILFMVNYGMVIT